MDAGSNPNSTLRSIRKIMPVLLLIVSLTTYVAQAASLQKRSVGQAHTTGMETCMNDSPCGWEVYDPTTRNHEYYVTSSCVCATGEKCVVKADDLAVSAYVYTCRVIPPRKSKSRSRAAASPGP